MEKIIKALAIFKEGALTNEAQARRACERACKKAPDLPRIKTIAAVGAYNAVIGGPRSDSKRLTGIISYLMRSGALIDPDFSIDLVNFSVNRNFLKEDKTYDLVFISYILREQLKGTFVYDGGSGGGTKRNFPSLLEHHRFYGVALSHDHNDSSWRQRISSCDAKIVATYGGQAEIGTHSLCTDQNRHEIVPVIDTPAHRSNRFSMPGWNKYCEIDLESRASLKTLYNNAANDLPMPWLGFAAAPSYLKDAALHLSEQTTFGRNVRKQTSLALS